MVAKHGTKEKVRSPDISTCALVTISRTEFDIISKGGGSVWGRAQRLTRWREWGSESVAAGRAIRTARSQETT